MKDGERVKGQWRQRYKSVTGSEQFHADVLVCKGKGFNGPVITMLWHSLCSYGHAWIKIISTSQLKSSSALSPPPRASTRDQVVFHTFGDDFSWKPFITPFRLPCWHHSHMSQKNWEENRDTHTHTHMHVHTHTNLFAAKILFGRDVFNFLFFLTAIGHITLERKEQHLRYTQQKHMLTQHIDSWMN